MSRNVLTAAETKDGKLRAVSFELLAAARTAANGGEVAAVLFGADEAKLAPFADELAARGADRVVIAVHRALEPYTSDAYVQAFVQAIAHVQPDLLLAPHTAAGKDYAPRVAAKLGIGLVSDCTAVEIDEAGDATFTRPIYAGKAFERRKPRSGIPFATMRPNNVPAPAAEAGRQAARETLPVEIKDLRTIVKQVARKAAQGVDLSEARVVVSGGRGVKSAGGFRPLEELAAVLNGAVGASRGACDAGYCDYALQIGQTGKVVTPDLYIACGISGAIQHVAGMSQAKVIVAINKDPEAPIFQIADYGIVGDLFEIVPLLTEEFRSMLASES